MPSHNKTIFIPPWRQLPEELVKGMGKIQKNPGHAVAESHSRMLVRNLMMTAGLVLVLAIAAIGRINQIIKTQNNRVSAYINYRQSLYGKVDEIDAVQNEFTLIYESSQDLQINQTKITKWKVLLPPGEMFNSMNNNICFMSTDIFTQTSLLDKSSCTQIIKTGANVMVEYLVLDPQNQLMVAKNIIGNR